MQQDPSERRLESRNLGTLLQLVGFLRPYRARMLLAAAALVVAAGSVLAFGMVIRTVVDHGIGSGMQCSLERNIEAVTFDLLMPDRLQTPQPVRLVDFGNCHAADDGARFQRRAERKDS